MKYGYKTCPYCEGKGWYYAKRYGSTACLKCNKDGEYYDRDLHIKQLEELVAGLASGVKYAMESMIERRNDHKKKYNTSYREGMDDASCMLLSVLNKHKKSQK